jgi:CBS domain-containing protein
MSTVRDVLVRKGTTVHTIAMEATVYEALVRMAQHHIGALVVVEQGAVVGVLSERDYARKVILRGKSSRELVVAQIMSRRVVTVRPETSIQECMELMTERRMRHLPVLSGNDLVGVISIGDVVKGLLAEKDAQIEQLEEYIRHG